MIGKTLIYIILSIILSAALIGCAADNPSMPSDNNNTLDFTSISVENDERTPEGVTTTLNIQDFKVTATTRGQYNTIILLHDALVKRTGLNSWTYSPKIEWPETPVNFYMVSPADIPWAILTWDKGAWINQYLNTGKTDLIVAADYDEMQHPGPVKVNFRHALARVSASIRTSISNEFEVRMRLAYITGIPLIGHYVWPTRSTNLPDNFAIGSAADSGIWTAAGWSTHGNEFFVLEKANDSEPEGIPLPNNDGSYIRLDGNDIQFMIPHHIQPSRFADYHWLGGNIIVVYRIIRRSDGATIWPSGLTPEELIYHKEGKRDWAVVPFPLEKATPDAEWLPGLNYSYRLTLNMPDISGSNANTRSHGQCNISAEVSTY